MLLKDKKVAVIGAGPVGLTFARLLQQKGVDVRVYERDENPEVRVWGATLDLHKGTGQDALREAGLLDDYYKTALPMGITMADTQGNVLTEKPPQYENPEINRNDLRQILLNSLAPGTVVWDSKFTALNAHSGRWLIGFDHGHTETADVVVAANGGMSAVRRYVSDAVVAETGSYIIQADVPEPQKNCANLYNLCNSNRLMVAGSGNLLVANPYNKGMLTYGIIFKKPEEWADGNDPDFTDIGHIKNLLTGRLAGWADIYRQLISVTSFFVGLPTRKVPLDAAWKHDRPLPITLIGDAAHLMPPFAGQGVNTGLVDALMLARNLTGTDFTTVEEAIDGYERQMFSYAKSAQAASEQNEKEMHEQDFSFAHLINGEKGR